MNLKNIPIYWDWYGYFWKCFDFELSATERIRRCFPCTLSLYSSLLRKSSKIKTFYLYDIFIMAALWIPGTPGKISGVESISFKVENFPVFTEKTSAGGCFSSVFKAALFPIHLLMAASHTSYFNSFFKNLWHWMHVY